MSMSNHLGQYHDVHSVFEHVRKSGPVSITFSSPSKAKHWQMRAYYYRKLLHKKQAEVSNSEFAATSTPYDTYVLRRKKDSTEVFIEPVVLDGVVRTLEGEVVDIEKADQTNSTWQNQEDEDLLAALDFAKTLGEK